MVQVVKVLKDVHEKKVVKDVEWFFIFFIKIRLFFKFIQNSVSL